MDAIPTQFSSEGQCGIVVKGLDQDGGHQLQDLSHGVSLGDFGPIRISPPNLPYKLVQRLNDGETWIRGRKVVHPSNKCIKWQLFGELRLGTSQCSPAIISLIIFATALLFQWQSWTSTIWKETLRKQLFKNLSAQPIFLSNPNFLIPLISGPNNPASQTGAISLYSEINPTTVKGDYSHDFTRPILKSPLSLSIFSTELACHHLLQRCFSFFLTLGFAHLILNPISSFLAFRRSNRVV